MPYVVFERNFSPVPTGLVRSDTRQQPLLRCSNARCFAVFSHAVCHGPTFSAPQSTPRRIEPRLHCTPCCIYTPALAPTHSLRLALYRVVVTTSLPHDHRTNGRSAVSYITPSYTSRRISPLQGALCKLSDACESGGASSLFEFVLLPGPAPFSSQFGSFTRRKNSKEHMRTQLLLCSGARANWGEGTAHSLTVATCPGGPAAIGQPSLSAPRPSREVRRARAGVCMSSRNAWSGGCMWDLREAFGRRFRRAPCVAAVREGAWAASVSDTLPSRARPPLPVRVRCPAPAAARSREPKVQGRPRLGPPESGGRAAVWIDVTVICAI